MGGISTHKRAETALVVETPGETFLLLPFLLSSSLFFFVFHWPVKEVDLCVFLSIDVFCSLPGYPFVSLPLSFGNVYCVRRGKWMGKCRTSSVFTGEPE